MLTSLELACEEFDPSNPEHVGKIKANDPSTCFYQCVGSKINYYVPGNGSRSPTIYRWIHSMKHIIPTGKKQVMRWDETRLRFIMSRRRWIGSDRIGSDRIDVCYNDDGVLLFLPPLTLPLLSLSLSLSRSSKGRTA